jgi:putative MATE family efflux protein
MTLTSGMDMTRGPLLGKILLFSLPLMATNILQMMFNAADIIVVGQFAGYTSLAAVGSTAPTIYLFINLLIGFSIAVNVLVANYVGAGNKDREIFLTLHTAMTIGIFGGILFGLIGILVTPWVLEVMQTPGDVIGKAILYLRIYFVSTPFLMIYNYGTAALRAIGDTKRPLIFLVISGITNVILNLFFVIQLNMDVAGVGWATVISQVVSAFLTVRCLSHENGPWKLHPRYFCLDRRTLYELCRIGIPAGLQACMFSLSNVVIQGAINTFGSVIVAANSAAMNVENFLYIGLNAFHQAGMTFISQNLGAGKWERIKKIFLTCEALVISLGLLESAAVIFWAPDMIEIFNNDIHVIGIGADRLYRIATLQVIFGIADVLVGCIRGFGISTVPMVINLLGTCVFRLVWISRLSLPDDGIHLVYLSYPISWTIIVIALAIYWVYLYRRTEKTVMKKRELIKAKAVSAEKQG